MEDVNGKIFRNSDAFYHLTKNSDDDVLLLREGNKYKVIIDRKAAKQNHQRILNRYRIEEDRSPDLR